MKKLEYTIGLAITGSFCTFDKIKGEIQALTEEGANVVPIFSDNTQRINSRFAQAEEFMKEVEALTGNKGIRTIAEAETIGPSGCFDILVIAPCTGNTMAKFSNGITDTPVLMAAKAHVRNEKPIVIAISTNDALGMNFKNIGILMNTKHIYFVPFGQDNYEKKAASMTARLSFLTETIQAALVGKQLQPVIQAPC